MVRATARCTGPHISTRIAIPLVLLTGTLQVSMGSGLAAQQRPLSLEADLRDEVAQRGVLAWDSRRPLRWTDFRAAPPDTDQKEAAQTSSGFVYGLQCDDTYLEYGVLAVFQPDSSWVRPSVRSDSLQSFVLPHEQGHFDIAEIAARLFRRELRELRVPCSSVRSTVSRMVQAADLRERALQQRYDNETVHGTRAKEQAQWLEHISRTLDSLSAMSAPVEVRKY